jgi:hypothetical protein
VAKPALPPRSRGTLVAAATPLADLGARQRASGLVPPTDSRRPVVARWVVLEARPAVTAGPTSLRERRMDLPPGMSSMRLFVVGASRQAGSVAGRRDRVMKGRHARRALCENAQSRTNTTRLAVGCGAGSEGRAPDLRPGGGSGGTRVQLRILSIPSALQANSQFDQVIHGCVPQTGRPWIFASRADDVHLGPVALGIELCRRWVATCRRSRSSVVWISFMGRSTIRHQRSF